MMKPLNGLSLATPGLALSLAASAAQANLITNGSFEQTTGGTSGQMGYNGFSVSGWSRSGYNFLFNNGRADSSGMTGQTAL